jgi:hypothetical protein
MLSYLVEDSSILIFYERKGKSAYYSLTMRGDAAIKRFEKTK